MAYGDDAYESVSNSGVQTLTAGQRTLLQIDTTGTGKWASVWKFPDGKRWDPTTSTITGKYVDERYEIRYAATMTPKAIATFVPFALHWEFDIGGTFGVAFEDWWDYPSLLGLLSLGAAARRKNGALPSYVGPTWQGNGCKVYVTAVGADCTLTNAALLISRVGG